MLHVSWQSHVSQVPIIVCDQISYDIVCVPSIFIDLFDIFALFLGEMIAKLENAQRTIITH